MNDPTRPTVHLYQIYDNVAQRTVGNLILQYHRAAAIRLFSDVLSDPQNDMARHADDYDLLHVGYSEQNTGVLTPIIPPEIVLTGSDFETLRAQKTAGS